MKAKILLSMAIFFVASLNFAQKADYTKYKGFVDFGNLEKFESGEEATEVVIEAHLLNMVSKMAGKNEPELAQMLQGIKLIKVHTFSVTEANYEKLTGIVNSVDKNLVTKGWDRIVKTRSKDELVNVFILTSKDEKVEGLVVTSIEKNGEAAFVNIVGNIDLETIGQLSDKFDIPAIDEVSKSKEKESSTKKWENNEAE